MWRLPWSNPLPLIPKPSSGSDVGSQAIQASTPKVSPHVVVVRDAGPEELMLVQNSLLNYNLDRAGPHRYSKLAAFLRDPNGRALGGITGSTYWGWLAIDFLWVPNELRRKGYGRRLVAAAEDEARERDCHHAYLDTFTFQGAAGFYENLGYVRLGSLPDFPFGHERIFFYKALIR